MSTKKKNILVPDYTNYKREYILDEKSYIFYVICRDIFIFLPRYFICACMYVSSEVIEIQCMPREKN